MALPSTLRRAQLILLTISLCLCVLADEWPGWRGPLGNGEWNEDGITDTLPQGSIPLRWTAPIAGGYSGPTVANGRVYITDRVTRPREQERVHCFAWDSGTLLWTCAYDCDYKKISYTTGPRANVAVSDGRVYQLGSMGHLLCLDANSGDVIWRKTPGEDYTVRLPTWGIAGSPVIADDLIIAQIGAEDGGCLIAFDKATGAERWRALDDDASYAAPVLFEQAGRKLVAVWTKFRIAAIDRATGEQVWSVGFPGGGTDPAIATPIVDGPWMFISAFWHGSVMLRLHPDKPAVEMVWHRKGQNERNTDALHACMTTPMFIGGYIYGIDSWGQLRCLDPATGDRLWEDTTVVPLDRWANAHMVRNGDRVWFFNEKGELIVGRVSPQGYQEISRSRLIKPTRGQYDGRGGVCWSHPAFAYRHVFARNDEELVCADLTARE